MMLFHYEHALDSQLVVPPLRHLPQHIGHLELPRPHHHFGRHLAGHPHLPLELRRLLPRFRHPAPRPSWMLHQLGPLLLIRRVVVRNPARNHHSHHLH